MMSTVNALFVIIRILSKPIDLTMNSFMMDNTFGEYSYRKIEDIIKEFKGSNLIE